MVNGKQDWHDEAEINHNVARIQSHQLDGIAKIQPPRDPLIMRNGLLYEFDYQC
jgi:hypothetical protein